MFGYRNNDNRTPLYLGNQILTNCHSYNLHQTFNYPGYFYFMLRQTKFAGQSADAISHYTAYLVTECLVYDL